MNLVSKQIYSIVILKKKNDERNYVTSSEIRMM